MNARVRLRLGHEGFQPGTVEQSLGRRRLPERSDKAQTFGIDLLYFANLRSSNTTYLQHLL